MMRNQQNHTILGPPRFKIGTEQNKGNLQEKKKSEEGFRNHNLGKTENRILYGADDQFSPLRTESREIILNLVL